MIPAHLRPYPAWLSRLDLFGKLAFPVGGLLVTEAIGVGDNRWLRIAAILAGGVLWAIIFSVMRDRVASSKRRDIA